MAGRLKKYTEKNMLLLILISLAIIAIIVAIAIYDHYRK